MTCLFDVSSVYHMSNYSYSNQSFNVEQKRVKSLQTQIKPGKSPQFKTSKPERKENVKYENKSQVSPQIIPSLKLSVESTICSKRLQMNAELLLLSTSNELWPISLHHLNKTERDFQKFSDCYEELLTCVKVFLLEINEIEVTIGEICNAPIKTESQVTCLNDLVNTSITLIELIYQTVYIISSTRVSWREPQTGILNRKTILSAIGEVELCCLRFKEILSNTSYSADDDIQQPDLESVMLSASAQLSKALTYLAICCRTAVANIELSGLSVSSKISSSLDNKPIAITSKDNHSDLLQLSMKNVSKSSQCLLASVKNYVEDRNPENRFITESFVNNVSVSIKSFAAIAASTKYVKTPAMLPKENKETKNTIFGACMSLISPTIELLVTIPAVINTSPVSSSPSPTRHSIGLQRANQCLQSMKGAVDQLQKTLSIYQNL